MAKDSSILRMLERLEVEYLDAVHCDGINAAVTEQ